MNKYEKVSSANISGVNYDSDNKILHVQFKNGHVYSYHNIPLTTYTAFMTSPSKGKYLKAHIHKDNNYKKVIEKKK